MSKERFSPKAVTILLYYVNNTFFVFDQCKYSIIQNENYLCPVLPFRGPLSKIPQKIKEDKLTKKT